MRSTVAAFVILIGVVASGCRGGSAATATGPQSRPREVVVLVDRSASQTAETRHRQMQHIKSIVDSLHFDDQLVLLRVHQSGVADESYTPFSGTMPRIKGKKGPTSLDREALAGSRKGAWSAAQSLFADSPPLKHTDILATLHIAAERLADAGDRDRVIVVLSDMLQSARGIEMEGLRAMPGADWIEQQKRKGLLPNLARSCVFVFGADATTASGIRVRNFWIEYFGAAGSVLKSENYRLTPPADASHRCR